MVTLLLGFVLIGRVDLCLTPSPGALTLMDPAYHCYCSLLQQDHRYNNPVVLVFFALLQESAHRQSPTVTDSNRPSDRHRPSQTVDLTVLVFFALLQDRLFTFRRQEAKRKMLRNFQLLLRSHRSISRKLKASFCLSGDDSLSARSRLSDYEEDPEQYERSGKGPATDERSIRVTLEDPSSAPRRTSPSPRNPMRAASAWLVSACACVASLCRKARRSWARAKQRQSEVSPTLS